MKTVCNSHWYVYDWNGYIIWAVLRIRDVYSGFRIPDPKTATKERSEKNMLSKLFCSLKYHKIKNYFIFAVEEKNLGQYTKNYRTFSQNIVI